MAKNVLISYGERNKVLRIPQVINEPDVRHLEKEFRKEFKFLGNVNLDISFQRFDNDWEEYVELDESCTIKNKEKLKAIVTPLLVSQSEVS